MILHDGWLAMLMAQLAACLLAFLGGGLLVLRFRSHRQGAATPPPAEGGLQAPTSPGSPIRETAPAVRECGKDLLLSHEMKNYLCAIRGNARLLRQKAEAPDQAALLDRIDKAVERLEGFAWKDQACPDVTASRLREWIDPAQAARNCRMHLEPGKAEFLFNASEGLPYIQGDPHRLDQVFTNLYGNALEAGADTVKTQFRRIGNELEIAVEDNGRGCRPETAGRLFDPFFTTKSAGPGDAPGPIRGLGLFIVRSIVEDHGGRIRATSKNERGFGETGLVVYMHFPLPAAREDRSPAVREDRASQRPERLPIASGA